MKFKMVLSQNDVVDAIKEYLHKRGYKLVMPPINVNVDTMDFTCSVEELPKPPAETLERAAVTLMTEYDNQQKAKP